MMNLGVIMGGMSTEHYVSIVSGTSIVNNLNKKKYKIFPIYIDLKGNWYKYIKPIGLRLLNIDAKKLIANGLILSIRL